LVLSYLYFSQKYRAWLIASQGYKYSIFNLVFATNHASTRIWDSLGFDVIGRVPGAGRLKDIDEAVDALIYGRRLDQ
jgi:L-amino acid N-acyltransferase YncA